MKDHIDFSARCLFALWLSVPQRQPHVLTSELIPDSSVHIRTAFRFHEAVVSSYSDFKHWLRICFTQRYLFFLIIALNYSSYAFVANQCYFIASYIVTSVSAP